MTKEELKKIRESCKPIKKLISAQRNAVVAYTDGSVVTSSGSGYSSHPGSNLQFSTEDWSDVVAISTGDDFIIGVRSDGTVISTGKNDMGQCNVGAWKDIVNVVCGRHHTVGLKADGTLIATGMNTDGGCNVRHLKNVVDITAGQWYTAALHVDGTVSECGLGKDLKLWKNIVDISGACDHLVGVRDDGTCVTVETSNAISSLPDITAHTNPEWRDIISVATYDHITVGLRGDGTVVVAATLYSNLEKIRQTVSKWHDIVAIEVGTTNYSNEAFVLGVKSNGTVVWAGTPSLSDIIPINSSYLRMYPMKCHYTKWKLFDNINMIEEEGKIKRIQRAKVIVEEKRQKKIIEVARQRQIYIEKKQNLEEELKNTTGFFKGSKRRALSEEIEKINGILKQF